MPYNTSMYQQPAVQPQFNMYNNVSVAPRDLPMSLHLVLKCTGQCNY